MKTDEFDYALPQELIAAHPVERRDASRMMVVHRDGGAIEHRAFAELPAFLRAGDLLVLNDTRVIPARVFGRKRGTGGRVELLLLEEQGEGVWDVLLRARRRPAPGAVLTLGSGEATATLVEDGEMGRATVRIESERPWPEVLEKIGLPPLPPYVIAARKARGAGEGQLTTPADRERYQTVYARQGGAVAAPTAGLHFTTEMLEGLQKAGVRSAKVTLHVGIGTFRPVEVEDPEHHVMESERYHVPGETARLVADTKGSHGRVVAVGTTTVRTLETVARENGHIAPGGGRTELFIYPPYTFRVVDALLTNFHLPKSTLLMMVCAFGGTELVRRAYADAVREKYRFYSYGDCMLMV